MVKATLTLIVDFVNPNEIDSIPCQCANMKFFGGRTLLTSSEGSNQKLCKAE